MSDSVRPHRRQPPRLLCPWDSPGRTVERVAISFSSAWKWKVKVKLLSRVWPSATPWTAAHQAPPAMGFSRQEYWSGVLLPSPMWMLTAPKYQSPVLLNMKCLFFSIFLLSGNDTVVPLLFRPNTRWTFWLVSFPHLQSIKSSHPPQSLVTFEILLNIY